MINKFWHFEFPYTNAHNFNLEMISKLRGKCSENQIFCKSPIWSDQVGSRRTSASSVRKTPCRVSSSPTATRVLSIFANSGFQLIQPDLSCLKMYQCHFVTPDDLTFPASSSLFPRTCFHSCWQWCCQTFGHCCCCYCSGCFHSSCSRCCWRWRCWRPAGERGRWRREWIRSSWLCFPRCACGERQVVDFDSRGVDCTYLQPGKPEYTRGWEASSAFRWDAKSSKLVKAIFIEESNNLMAA